MHNEEADIEMNGRIYRELQIQMISIKKSHMNTFKTQPFTCKFLGNIK